MDREISRVAREMYRAFSGLNEGFENVSQEKFSTDLRYVFYCRKDLETTLKRVINHLSLK